MTRIVVTGMGILAPNAHGLDDYSTALREGRSGIRFVQELADLGFGCQVAGIPVGVEELKSAYFLPEALSRMSEVMLFSAIAAIDCWRDAGFEVPAHDSDEVDWETGAVIGTGAGSHDTLGNKVVPLVNGKRIRRLGGSTTEQIMVSGVSANIGGMLGLGGPVTTNASACSTGTESVLLAAQILRQGRVKRMLAAAAEGASAYTWGPLDSMFVMVRDFNDRPAEACRPMSATAAGFAPSAGAGAILLETLESAEERGARIYAELLGGYANSGGQRQGGSITAPNPEGIRRCIRGALADAGVEARDVDAVNGHLTGTMADPMEIECWRTALSREASTMPWIQATKSLVGHGLGAAGAFECVASILELHEGFLHPSVNCEDLHAAIEPYADRVVREAREEEIRVLAEASFGFGDINGCLILGKWDA